MLASLLSLTVVMSGQLPPMARQPLVRTLLDGGGSVIVERRSGEKTIGVTLTASSAGTEETALTHGWGHLLEHLVARGASSSMDLPLESAGWSMAAETNRDAIQFKFEGPAGSIQPAIDGIADIISCRTFTKEQIANEALTMREEGALKTNAILLSEAAWSVAYGERGLAPFGTVAAMASATPESLGEWFTKRFNRARLTIAIVGDVDPAPASALAERAILKAPPKLAATLLKRDPGSPGATTAPKARGMVRGAIAPPLDDIRTAALIAAGLSIANEIEAPFFIYTPSLRNSLAMVGSRSADAQPLQKLDELVEKHGARLFPTGKRLAELWWKQLTARPISAASFYGLLQSQSQVARFDAFSMNLAQVRQADFLKALSAYDADAGVTVMGGKS